MIIRLEFMHKLGLSCMAQVNDLIERGHLEEDRIISMQEKETEGTNCLVVFYRPR